MLLVPQMNPARRQPTEAKHCAIVLGILAVALLLRGPLLDAVPLSHDEFESLAESASFLDVAAERGNGPLYFAILRAWRIFFGDSAIALRSLSVLFSIASIAMVWRCSLQLSDDHRVATLATTLFAVLPNWIWHARDARMYPEWVFFFLVAVSAGIELVQAPQGRRARYVYFTATVCGLLCHNYMIFYSVGLAAALWLGLSANPCVPRPFFWTFVRIHLPIALVALAAFARLWFKVVNPQQYFYFYLSGDWSGVQYPFIALADLVFRTWIFPFDFPECFLVGITVAALAAISFNILQRAGRATAGVMLFCGGFLPWLIITIAPIRHYSRLLAPTTPILCMLLASAFYAANGTRRAVVAGGILTLLALSAAQFPLVYADPERWAEICHSLNTEGRGSQLIFTNEERLKHIIHGCVGDRFPIRVIDWQSPEPLTVKPLADSVDTTWIVHSTSWSGDPDRNMVLLLSRSPLHEMFKYEICPVLDLYRFNHR
ncbi:MAG: hypothetical protein U0136_15405 [Bdellovibrionota bacterium]